jgi:hypothetical protein
MAFFSGTPALLPNGNQLWYGDYVPSLSTDGTYMTGDYLWITNSTGLPDLFKCTAGGSPGTWIAAHIGKITTTDPTASNDNTQGYAIGSLWINTTALRIWECVSAATGAAAWVFSGAAYSSGGSTPATEVTQFGSGTALAAAEGNINRQVPGVAGAIAPGATGVDNVVAVYSLPANSLDAAGRGITVTASGNFAANGNNKRIKLWWNPATAVVGSTVGASGTLMADTGTVTQSGLSWVVGGNVFKRGAAGSNTQTVVSNGMIVGSTHGGVTISADATAVENAPILVAVTINNTTTATDAVFVWLEVNAMN